MGNVGGVARLDYIEADHDVPVWWRGQVESMLASLSTVLDLAQDLAVRRQESMPSFGASLRSEGRRFADWSEIHPCPDPNTSYLAGKVGPSCRALADLVDMESTNPHGPDWMFIDIRLNGLRHVLAKTAAVLAGTPDRTDHGFDDTIRPVDPRPGGRFSEDARARRSDAPGTWLVAKPATWLVARAASS
jgi:hypothetical protein